MRVAVLSHNDIRKDARIIKEVKTLENELSDVTVFGLHQRGKLEGDASYPFKSPVVLTERRLSQGEAQAVLNGWPRFLTYKRLRRIGVGFLIASALIGLSAILQLTPAFAPLPLFITGVASILISRNARHELKKNRAATRERSDSKGARLYLSPKTGELVCTAKARAALFKQSYHLVEAVRAEAARCGPFQVIHAHDLAGLDAGMRIKQQMGGTLIWDAHEIYEDLANPDPANAANARQTIREAAPFVDHFITINEGLAKFYKTHHPNLPDPTILMNATVRADPPIDDGRLRQAMGAKEDEKILLFQGGFSMHRGLPKLVRAARDFPQGWLLAMMGEGHLEAELRTIAAEINNAVGEERIRFLPSVPQVELVHWTAGATLGAIPYENVAANHWFCTPNKLWEYPAAGVPFIAPRLYEISRIAEQYGTGFLFPAQFTAKTISDLIGKLDDKTMDEKRANIARFIQEMSWENFVPRLTALYKKIAIQPAEAKRPIRHLTAAALSAAALERKTRKELSLRHR